MHVFIGIYDNRKRGQREEVLIKYLLKQTMELMFIPSPSISHLIPMVELAKLLTERDDRLMIKVFVMKQPSDSKVSASLNHLIPPPSAIVSNSLTSLLKTNPPLLSISFHL